MLVLTRHINECIIIGDNLIKIKVISVQGDSVRLGFDANKNLSIHREEIYHKIMGNHDFIPPRVKKDPVIRSIEQPNLENWGNK